ncbi:MAG: hypothetical protein HGA82_01215, partial [Anaerolineales bacterium]|nr:hypothetical protein [Anaerolineales bacterium]
GYGTRWPTADDTNNYCATFEGDPGIDAEGQIMLDLPTGHRVDIRVRTPAPDLWLNKWSDGQPPSGGYHCYICPRPDSIARFCRRSPAEQ